MTVLEQRVRGTEGALVSLAHNFGSCARISQLWTLYQCKITRLTARRFGGSLISLKKRFCAELVMSNQPMAFIRVAL